MNKYVYSFFIFIIAINSSCAQNKTIAEKLGYSAEAKLLIIHADDLGVAHSENSASISGLEKSPVNSASIMVPCPWFPEIAQYARKNKSMDFGLHLTLTSEWKNYKWGPVSSKDKVPSLVNKNGYFYESVDSLVSHASPEEVVLELRSQVKKAYENGIDVTHLDTHMGALAATPEFLAAYIKVGKEFKLPVLLNGGFYDVLGSDAKELLNEKDIIVDGLHMAFPDNYEKGMAQYYSEVLQNLNPGLNAILIHLAYDDAEMQAVTIDHHNYGAAWRQADYDFFTSETCKKLLKKHNIVLVTWRELRDAIVRAE